MKIDPLNRGYVAPQQDKAAPKPPVKPQEATHPGQDTPYNVQISALVAQAATPAPEDEEIRHDKIAAIRNQLASGSYNISGKDVANKILGALKG